MVNPKKKSKRSKAWLEEPSSESRSITPSPPAVDKQEILQEDLLGEEEVVQTHEKDDVDLATEPVDDLILEESVSMPIPQVDYHAPSSESPDKASLMSGDSAIVKATEQPRALLIPAANATETQRVESKAAITESPSASAVETYKVESKEAITESPPPAAPSLPARSRDTAFDFQRISRRPSDTYTRGFPASRLSSSPLDRPLISTSPDAALRRLPTSPRTRNRSLHLPQSHYFMASDLNPPAKDVERTVRLDTLSDAGDQAAAIKAYDVVLVGTMDALDVYRILPEKMEVIARLHGLGGMVLDAKIIPVVTTEDPDVAIRPLVALLVHGSVDDGGWVKYQTTLEVYSLKTQEHVATLFKGLPVTSSGEIPEPLGALRLDANGAFLVLSSGTSGEVFVFRDNVAIGKYWTTVQERALLALGKRWLVIVCPDSSTVSIGAPTTGKFASFNAPIQPPITADLVEDDQGMLSRLSRQAAQELLKASRKGVEMGISGWKEFTNPTQPSQSEFPPTNAPEIKKRDEPAVVSVVDLQRGPVCTFALQTGCSFVSLGELKLVTTDRAGEVSSIWDLTDLQAVRCVQKIERNSPSVVMGAVWDGERLALQTAKTIHLHEIEKKKAVKWSWKGRHMFAQGLSLAQDAWHADDNKIRMSGDVRWIRGGLAVASTTNVYVYTVVKEKGLKAQGRRDFALPETSGNGFWALRPMNERIKVVEQDEIETNPLYCPFHVDRRISMMVYTAVEKDVWCFGDVLPMGIKVNTEEYDEFEETLERSVFKVDE